MNYGLPTSVEIQGEEYAIRTDFRTILDIFEAMNDPDLTPDEIGIVSLTIFYEDFENMPSDCYKEAVEEMFAFINMGDRYQMETKRQEPKLMDWEQDFNLMIAPINHVAGTEIRSLEYLHWWTFLSYYQEIDGDSLFSRIVGIRDKKARGKPLDKEERRFYARNKEIVDFQRKYSDAEQNIIDYWTKG